MAIKRIPSLLRRLAPHFPLKAGFTLGPPSRSQASNKVRSIDLDVMYYLKKYNKHNVPNREPLPKASLWENGEPNNLSIY